MAIGLHVEQDLHAICIKITGQSMTACARWVGSNSRTDEVHRWGVAENTILHVKEGYLVLQVFFFSWPFRPARGPSFLREQSRRRQHSLGGHNGSL
jgi:hypothetical protein